MRSELELTHKHEFMGYRFGPDSLQTKLPDKLKNAPKQGLVLELLGASISCGNSKTRMFQD